MIFEIKNLPSDRIITGITINISFDCGEKTVTKDTQSNITKSLYTPSSNEINKNSANNIPEEMTTIEF